VPRKTSILTTFAAIVAVLLVALPAGAQSSGDMQAMEAEAAQAQQELAQLQGEVGAAYEAYEEALAGLEALNSDINATSNDLMEAEKELIEAQGNLEDQASRVYRSGNVGFIDVLVGVESFSDFAARMELWVRVLSQQQAEVNRIGEIRDALAADREALEQQRDERSAAVQAAADRRTEAAELESRTQEYLNGLSAEMQGMVQAQLFADAEAQAQQERILAARERENALAEALRQQAEEAQRRAAEQQAAAEEQAAAAERAA
jgi:peptidoglycan DL-endopeptidase RipA